MRRPPLAAQLAWLATVLAAASVLAGCGGSDRDVETDGGEPKRTTTGQSTASEDEHPEDAEEHEAGEPTRVPDPVPDGELPPIQVTAPSPLSYVSGAFVLQGTAQVFEGALRWAILDARLEPMVQGSMTASCGAPCRGKFRVRVPLAKVAEGSWELHVWAPPVDDDDPERVHDTMVPITVTAEPVEGAPEPGDTPPGGAPGG